MKSRLGYYFLNLGDVDIEVVASTKPQVCVFMDSDPGRINEFVGWSPNTFVVLRHYIDDGSLQAISDPAAAAQEWWRGIAGYAQACRPMVANGCLMTTNEPVVDSIEQAKWMNRFQVECNKISHDNGFQICAYSFAVGNPHEVEGNTDPFHLWDFYLDGLATADFLSLHEYRAPRLQLDAGWYCLRYRQVYKRLPQEAQKPLVITECGLDGGTLGEGQRGWRHYTSEQDYVHQLSWYDSMLQEDSYVVGGAIFAWQDFGRPGGFGIGNSKPIMQYIRSGGDALALKDYVKDPSKTKARHAAPLAVFTANPPVIRKASPAVLRWDVEGVQTVRLKSADGKMEDVVGHGERVVTPTKSAKYTLIVGYEDGKTTRHPLTLKVQSARQPASGMVQADLSTGAFSFTHYPVDFNDHVITQKFGSRPDVYKKFGLPGHEGLDLRAPEGTTVFAVAGGVVSAVFAGTGPYGINVRVRHSDGYETIYAHLSEAQVKLGQVVDGGAPLGKSGCTGNCEGAHLHFTLKRKGITFKDAAGNTWPSNIHDPTTFIEPLL